MSARIWLVIPTYNEAENVGPIVRAVAAEMSEDRPGRAPHPGRRRQLARRHRARWPTSSPRNSTSVEVLHRAGKNGLGRAYIAGFEHALAGGAELVIEMDADFSHDPKYLGELIGAAEDADLVLGSRYVPGGAVRNWGMLRKLISRGGSIYARAVLGVERPRPDRRLQVHPPPRARDDRPATASAPTATSSRSRSPTARSAPASRSREVPIMFVDRAAGASKMSWQIALEAMLLVPEAAARSARAS